MSGKLNCVTGDVFKITENRPYTGSNTSINVFSMSKQKRVNVVAITPQHVTLTTKRVVHFIDVDFENMRENVPFPRASHILGCIY